MKRGLETTRESAPCCLLINKGSGSVRELWNDTYRDRLLETLRVNGWDPELEEVEGEELEDSLIKGGKSGHQVVFCGGGDGTINALAERVSDKDMTLGILPFGTLNMLARDLGMPLDPIEAASRLYPGKTRAIDILDLNGHSCLCVTFFGFYPFLLEKTEDTHSRYWWMKFWKMGSQLISAFRNSPRLAITLNPGENIRTRLLVLVPGNYEDTVGLVPKRSSLESGNFHVFSSNHQTRRSMVRLAFHLILGSPKSDPNFSVRSGQNLELKIRHQQVVKVAIDGEVHNLELPVRANLHQHQLKVLRPVPEET